MIDRYGYVAFSSIDWFMSLWDAPVEVKQEYDDYQKELYEENKEGID